MRQLFISDDTTVAYSSGVLATGAVDIQKKDSNGEVLFKTLHNYGLHFVVVK